MQLGCDFSELYWWGRVIKRVGVYYVIFHASFYRISLAKEFSSRLKLRLLSKK